VEVAAAVSVGVGPGKLVGVGVCVNVEVGKGVGVGLKVGTSVAVLVGVGLGKLVAVGGGGGAGVSVGACSGSGVSVGGGTGVEVGGGTGVWVGRGVKVGARVFVGAGVRVRVAGAVPCVGVALWAAVCVSAANVGRTAVPVFGSAVALVAPSEVGEAVGLPAAAMAVAAGRVAPACGVAQNVPPSTTTGAEVGRVSGNCSASRRISSTIFGSTGRITVNNQGL